MIKLIIFDLDGVLVDAKTLHYEALNKALGPDYAIEWSEHLSTYDGLKTNQKLELLHTHKGLPIDAFKDVWTRKQNYTLESLRLLKQNHSLQDCMDRLIADGYKLAVCSNSIRKTVLTVLSRFDIIDRFELILSNEDIQNSKPHPEIYWRAMSTLGYLPHECLIVEDSPPGLLAAFRSSGNVLRVGNPKEITYSVLKNELNQIKINKMSKWKDKKLNVIIPMAGAGSRFEQAGYTFPKPLIEINGKPMIQVVVDNLNLDANYIYVVQKAHRSKYNLDSLLNLITPNCTIIETNGLTEGAACTALLAKSFIDNDNPLFFANSDQFVEWNSNDFMYKMQETKADGGIVIFKSIHPKWSFAQLNDQGLVTQVAEKNPISDNATVGYYFWKHGSDFVKYAERMIGNGDRVNGEFYVCPVFNEAIKDSKQIRTHLADKMWGLGTPEDLNYYIKNYGKH